MRGRQSVLAILLTAALQLDGAASEAMDLNKIVAELGAHPCAIGELTCVTLEVPVDHRANSGPTIRIEHSISFATEASKGVLIYVVGGPGLSGLAVADDYLAADGDKLKENMDIVFFDQRGVGPDHGVACPKALTAFSLAEYSICDRMGAINIAKRYATDCPAEFKSRDLVAYLDTDQALADLEMFRHAIGAPQLWIYGESYGTQFAQQYAEAYPGSVKGVIIDGVVDLNLDFDGYYASYVRASEDILSRVLAACGMLLDCRTDMNGDAAAVYDGLAARAAEKPIAVDFPLADGNTAKRELTVNMLAYSAFYALYGPDERAAFLRALAAASRNNLVPMLQLTYSNMLVNPQTLEAADDPTWYGAAYYAVTCSDYGEGTADGDATAWQIIKRAQAFAPQAPRLLDFYYMERLACAYWPKRAGSERPTPYAGGAFPTLILSADVDPITPLSMSQSVFDEAKNASRITMRGGPHVIWGRGLSCPDETVDALMIDGKRPAQTDQFCEQEFIGEYTGLTLTETAEAGDAITLARALETEIEQSVELSGWDEEKDLTVGCDFGGTVTASAGDAGAAYSLAGCAWWSNIRVTGKGTKVDDEGSESLTMEIAVSGDHRGQLTYKIDKAADSVTAAGTYDGKQVQVP